MSSRYLSTAEAAKLIGVSTSTMALIIAEPGGPKTFDVSRQGDVTRRARIRIREDDLHEWMKSNERPQAAS